MTLKVGDKVTITEPYHPKRGMVCEVTSTTYSELYPIAVKWGEGEFEWEQFKEGYIKPVEAPVSPETGVGVSRYTAGMPQGVEARHIMAKQGWYKEFCKGSILKYITRLDHKGQYLSDLNKIKTYAEELIRLEEEEEEAAAK